MSGNLEARLARLEQRVASMIQPGRVTHVDAARKMIRMELGDDDEPMSSPWVRYGQIAGALKVHTLPTVGQQMTLVSASGDIEQGLAMPLGWSNDHAAPGDGEQPVLTFGDVRVEVQEDALEASIGAIVMRLSADGLTVTVGDSVLMVAAGQIKLTGSEIRTDGITVLNNGTRQVVYKGSVDTGGDTNNQGAGDGVLV